MGDQDTPVAIALSGSDADGDGLTYVVLVQPQHGALSGSGASLTYTPAADYSGPDGFTFRANDGTVESNVATVTITVTPVNDAPIASDQSVTTPEDTPVAITLTGSDVDGDSLTYVVLAQPQHGTLSGSGTSLTYTPAADYSGPDGFTFRVSDGTLSAMATVTLTVTPVNDPPLADGGPRRTVEQGSVVMLDTKDVVYYLSLIGFFLFLTMRSLESRKWRGLA